MVSGPLGPSGWDCEAVFPCAYPDELALLVFISWQPGHVTLR